MHRTDLAIIRQARSNKVKRQTETMITGPHLDGHTLIVPSEWYNEQAAKFWRQHGFAWNEAGAAWQRDTQRPLHSTGKRYTAEVWLQSTRRQFYQFWPTLLYKCRQCGQQFARIDRYQTICDDCIRQRQEAHDRHFSY